MSLAYKMRVTISSFTPEYREQIIESCKRKWKFELNDVCSTASDIVLDGKPNLGSRESAECEFADQLAATIWIANKGLCDVNLNATCMEYVPCNTFVRNGFCHSGNGPVDEEGASEDKPAPAETGSEYPY